MERLLTGEQAYELFGAAIAAGDLDLLAALSHGSNLSLGCYCEDERRCHRSILKRLLIEKKARVADDK